MADAKPDFNGKWMVVENENFENYLAANGANWIARKAASKMKGPVEYIQEGDNFTIRISNIMFTREEKFTIGVPCDQTQMSGAVTECIASWEGNKLVIRHTPKDDKSKAQTITRELVDGKMVMVMEVGDVVAKRVLEKAT